MFLNAALGWGNTQVGSFLALWIVGYGMIQVAAPRLLRRCHHDEGPDGATARWWAFVLALVPAGLALALIAGFNPAITLIVGLAVFGAVFAINSSVHSYLVLAYTKNDKVALDVGFYYMANAGGRLIGTVLSGWVYQISGLTGCLWWSVGFVIAAAVLSFGLSSYHNVQPRRAPVAG